MRDSISFYLNGFKKEVRGAEAFLTLSSFLRYNCGLTGTKVVCAEGDCGACTIMSSKWRPQKTEASAYQSINSCIAMTFAMDGANLVSVEGMTAKNEDLSEVQCSMVRNFGGQCGFCTPGFVMSIANMHEHKTKPTEQNAKNYLTGNLCRCTGYSPILKAALDVDIKKHVYLKDKFPPKSFTEQMQESILISAGDLEFFAPTTVAEATNYKNQHSEVIIFSGSTDLGVQFNKGHLEPKKILSLHLIAELYDHRIENNEVSIGSRVTLSEMQTLIEDKIPSLNHFLNIFASPQIKNAGTVIGNLANGSPIADLTPVLMALDTEIELASPNVRRTINLSDFYLGYKKLNLQKDEIVTRIRFRVPDQKQKIENYKISQRRDLDISTVNASFNFTMNGSKIEKARMAYGGVAATTLRLSEIETRIEGKELNKNSVAEIKNWITDSIKPLSDSRGTAEFRKILAGNLFEKFTDEHFSL